MNTVNLVYGAAETRSKISEIQNIVKNGLIPKVINKNTHDASYMLNNKIFESLLDCIENTSIIEFDEELKVYTIYNKIVPQIYGEGLTKIEAIDKMVKEAKLFADDYVKNIELFSNVFDGVQQFIVACILLNIENDVKIREILKIVW